MRFDQGHRRISSKACIRIWGPRLSYSFLAPTQFYPVPIEASEPQNSSECTLKVFVNPAPPPLGAAGAIHLLPSLL